MVYYEVKFNCLLRIVFFIIILQVGAHWTIYIYIFIYLGSVPPQTNSWLRP